MKKYIFFILLASCIMACNKNTYVTPIDSWLLQHFNYQPGSYWVYLDSPGGAIDSYYVYENITENNNDNGIVYQTNIIQLLNFYNGVNMQNPNSQWFLRDKNAEFGAATNDTSGVDFFPLFLSPLDSGYQNGNHVIGPINGFICNGVSFDSVYHVQYYDGGLPTGCESYISVKYGIIKIINSEYNILTSINLLRLKIII